MIGSFLKSASRWHYIVMACALAHQPLAAQDMATSAISKPYNLKARPATELLGRSLGLTAGVLAIGAVALVLSRKYSSKLLSEHALGQKTSHGQRPRITGRVRLTPRQTVHVLNIGQRVLVIGTGPQGAPELLTEWAVDPDESQEFITDELSESLPQDTLSMPAHRAAETAA